MCNALVALSDSTKKARRSRAEYRNASVGQKSGTTGVVCGDKCADIEEVKHVIAVDIGWAA